VPIKTELRFIDDYLFLQKMRFEDRLQIVKEISNDCLETLIPPMLLQPLIENAMIHGIAKMEEGGAIKIKIEKFEKSVSILVENSLPISVNKTAGNGVGLRNCNERLRVIYGNDSGLIIDANENEYKVSFSIPA
jgi:LytS/YehU family sensor histidine kinase